MQSSSKAAMRSKQLEFRLPIDGPYSAGQNNAFSRRWLLHYLVTATATAAAVCVTATFPVAVECQGTSHNAGFEL
jgi:hypothetical protein